MKKLILAAIVLSTLSLSAFAFTPEVSSFVNGEVAVSRVLNDTDRTITCEGNAFGQSYAGDVLSSAFNQISVDSGMSVDVYVYATGRDPFINAWAQVDCKFSL